MTEKEIAKSDRRSHRINATCFFTISNVAQTVDVCPRTVRRWIDKGLLVAYRVGKVVRIDEADLRTFLALHRED